MSVPLTVVIRYEDVELDLVLAEAEDLAHRRSNELIASRKPYHRIMIKYRQVKHWHHIPYFQTITVPGGWYYGLCGQLVRVAIGIDGLIYYGFREPRKRIFRAKPADHKLVKLTIEEDSLFDLLYGDPLPN